MKAVNALVIVAKVAVKLLSLVKKTSKHVIAGMVTAVAKTAVTMSATYGDLVRTVGT